MVIQFHQIKQSDKTYLRHIKRYISGKSYTMYKVKNIFLFFTYFKCLLQDLIMILTLSAVIIKMYNFRVSIFR